MLPRFLLSLAAITVALFSAGCAVKPQNPVELNSEALKTSRSKVGVAMTQLPKVEVHLPGADCLLCIAFASAANSDLRKHADTLTLEELSSLKQDIVSTLKKRDIDAVLIEAPLDLKTFPELRSSDTNTASRNFSSLKSKYNVDRLLVIDVNAVGFQRNYSAYIPTSDPKGLLRGTGYIVNLTSHTYEWYLPVNVLKSADGKWDEPGKFPGLTNAYFQALEFGKDEFLRPLASK
jgi:hypothetical protein